MTFVDRIARLGWIATGALALSASACATSQGSTVPVSTTSTTGATGYTPEGVELYLARQDGVSSCGADLRENVDFAPRAVEIAPSELPDIDRWARCLNQPELQHATVVLVGGDVAAEPQPLFVQRAQRIRDALVARGVDPRRVVIGAANAAREGGRNAAATGVRVEVTNSQTLRGFVPPDTGVRRSAYR
jgi:hypothetical protein